MSPAVFEPTFTVTQRPQIHTLDRMITGIGMKNEVPVEKPVHHKYHVDHLDTETDTSL